MLFIRKTGPPAYQRFNVHFVEQYRNNLPTPFPSIDICNKFPISTVSSMVRVNLIFLSSVWLKIYWYGEENLHFHAVIYLQWTVIGPSSSCCSYVLCTWPIKSNIPSPFFVILPSVQPKKWNCLIFRTVPLWRNVENKCVSRGKPTELQILLIKRKLRFIIPQSRKKWRLVFWKWTFLFNKLSKEAKTHPLFAFLSTLHLQYLSEDPCRPQLTLANPLANPRQLPR